MVTDFAVYPIRARVRKLGDAAAQAARVWRQFERDGVDFGIEWERFR